MIKPPRALWVPFELGRPLGAPGDSQLQRRVLVAALELFEADAGPVLADFPEDGLEMDEVPDDQTGLACPVNFAPMAGAQTDLENMVEAFRAEVAELYTWYDLQLKRSGRTAVVTFAPHEAAELLVDYLEGRKPGRGGSTPELPVALRLAAQDLKAFYFEAMLVRPGEAQRNSAAFTRWFWQKTVAGHLLKGIREKCLLESDNDLRFVGKLLLVPMDQL